MLFALYSLYESPRARRAVAAFADELRTLAGALLSPTSVVAQVHEMRALQLEADRIEAAQPQRAAVLRQRASRIGL